MQINTQSDLLQNAGLLNASQGNSKYFDRSVYLTDLICQKSKTSE